MTDNAPLQIQNHSLETIIKGILLAEFRKTKEKLPNEKATRMLDFSCFSPEQKTAIYSTLAYLYQMSENPLSAQILKEHNYSAIKLGLSNLAFELIDDIEQMM